VRFTNSTTNSYKRLVPGYEAPVNLAYSRRNRSAAVRIPVYSPHRKAKRLEYRLPDGSSNPYLAFAAILMAMLDGIKNKTRPGEPLDKDIYDLEPEELAKVPKTPASLGEALGCLDKDQEFLLQGDVFTEDVISTWIWYKREKEVEAIRLRPHPYEFGAVLRHLSDTGARLAVRLKSTNELNRQGAKNAKRKAMPEELDQKRSAFPFFRLFSFCSWRPWRLGG